jgi:NTP pyrophosphatase (non-canonical NTP hydrolase)
MINELGKEIHKNNVAKGFYEKEKNTGEMLCLIHSEVSEALEADRKGRYATGQQLNFPTLHYGKDDFIEHYNQWIKGTFEEEMADIFIRVLDMCAYRGIDLEQHVKAKMRYNSLRPHKHGKAY